MKHFCLIGHPLGHSISPDIHRRLFSLRGFAGEYTLREIPPAAFDSRVASLCAFDGFNVTIPYKRRIIPHLAELSARAEKYGAVNTVCTRGGKLTGHNTDGEGFLRALRQADIPLQGNVLLCGTGGAAHMMACEALAHGCRLTVAARTLSRAQAFSEHLSRQFHADVAFIPLCGVNGRFDLVLNATPAGMYPHAEECPLPFSALQNVGAVFDAVYNPAETLLLKKAAECGAKTEGGLSMLVWQAAAAQQIWAGLHFRPEEIRGVCREMQRVLEKNFPPAPAGPDTF